ncbi:MAG: glycosyltransferase family 4 protein [Thermoplasmata archaeon]|nr:glycosyltransferase family 4 protein [Thermoplasmata archaeon]
MKRILFLQSIIRSEDFGGLTHQIELIRNLSAHMEVYFLPEGTEKAQKAEPGRKDLLFISSHGSKAGTIFKHTMNILFKGFTALKRYHIQAIYVRHGISTIPAIFLGKVSRLPVIVEMNGILADEVSIAGGWSGWRYPLILLDRLACRYSTGIIAVTGGLENYVVEYFGRNEDDIAVIPNGANTHVFKPMNMTQCKTKLGLDTGSRYIGFVGNLSAWQGVEYLIEAMTFIRKKMPDVKLLVIGSGVMANRLEDLARSLQVGDIIQFTGAMDYEKIPEYVNACNVCAAPFVRARNERIGLSPLKVYEYAACGRPQVASNICSLSFLEERKMGLLVEPESSQLLAGAIMQILSDRERAERMGARGREYIEKEHSWEVIAHRISDACTKFLDR